MKLPEKELIKALGILVMLPLSRETKHMEKDIDGSCGKEPFPINFSATLGYSHSVKYRYKFDKEDEHYE